MRFILYFIAALMLASPAMAVCVSVNRITDTEMCMSRGAGTRCVAFEDLRTSNRNSWARQLTALFQGIMETRDRVTSMVSDEETRFDPPHREDFYLGDIEGVHQHDLALDLYLIFRCDVIAVTWNGDQFNVRIRTARRDRTPEGELIQ